MAGQAAATDATAGRLTDSKPSSASVFVSYSRQDAAAFVDRLEVALKASAIRPLIDRRDIVAFEDWWKRIQRLITDADTVVFVVSPNAVARTSVCEKELAFAQALNKRLAPIVLKRVNDEAVPEALRRLNFIFFDDEAQFEASFAQLVGALGTDIDWVRKHTDFGRMASEWLAAGQSNGLLLRSPTLEEAERWSSARPRGAPPLTEETRTFIAESRRGTTRRRNILTASLGGGFVGALSLAGLAYWQRNLAVDRALTAEAVNLWQPLLVDVDQREPLFAVAWAAESQRKRFIEVMFAQSRFAARFSKDDAIARALIGLSTDRRNLLVETLQRGIANNPPPYAVAMVAKAADVADAWTLVQRLTELSSQTSDSQAVRLIGSAAGRLASDATPDQAAKAVVRLTEALQRMTDVDAILVGAGIERLAPRLASDQAAQSVARLTKALDRITDASALRALARAIAALAPKLTNGQTVQAVGRLIEVLDETTNSSSLQALAEGIAALGPSPDRSARALARLMAVLQKTTDASALQELAEGIAALAPGSDQKAQAVARLTEAIRKTTEASALKELAKGIAALAPGPDQAAEAVASLLEALRKTTDEFALEALARAIAALASAVPADQVAQAVTGLTEALQKTTSAWARMDPAGAIAALASRLTPDQAARVAARLVDALQEEKVDVDAFLGLAAATAALGSVFTPDQAAQVVARFMKAHQETTDDSAQQQLAEGVTALAPRLTAGQATQVLNQLMKALQNTSSVSALQQLTEGIAALAPSRDQVAQALLRLTDAFRKATDSGAIGALARGIVALAPKLTSDQAAQAAACLTEALQAATILKAADSIQRTTNYFALEALAEGILALAPRLANDRAVGVLVFELLKVPWTPLVSLQKGLMAYLGQTIDSTQTLKSLIDMGRERFGNAVDFERPPQSPAQITQAVQDAMRPKRL